MASDKVYSIFNIGKVANYVQYAAWKMWSLNFFLHIFIKILTISRFENNSEKRTIFKEDKHKPHLFTLAFSLFLVVFDLVLAFY